jgi:tryptophan synthase alpha subunit
MNNYSVDIDITIDDTLELIRVGKSWKTTADYVLILYNNETRRYSYKHFNIKIDYT